MSEYTPFKMNNPFKQVIPSVAMPLGASGALDVSSKSKYLLSEEDISSKKPISTDTKKWACNANPKTEWKNGKCVSKIITMKTTKKPRNVA